MARLKSEQTCRLKNRIPGLHVLISSLPDSASRTHVELLGKKLCLVNLITKDTHLVFSINKTGTKRRVGANSETCLFQYKG